MSFLRHPLAFHVLVLIICVVCVHELRTNPTGTLEAYFLNIGQGDATLLVSPSGHQILVDGGPDRSVLGQLSHHMSFLDRTIDLVVLTHPDSDHSAGLLWVLRRYNVRAVLITGVQAETQIYRDLLSEISSQHIPILLPDPRKDIVFDDGLVFDVVAPLTTDFGKKVDDTNNSGIVFRALWNDRSILMTGDIEAPAEDALLRSGQPFESVVLKVAHHGSKTSSGTGFLLAASPKQAMISAARQNKYGHPNKEILNRLRSFGILTHVTAWEGEGLYKQ